MDNIAQQDSVERAFNKLARTFAAQMETLKRYRSRGEQLVRVERVTVNEGRQAIVGPVTHGGGAPRRKGNHPLEMRVFLPKSSALFGNLDAHARAVQGSRGAGLDRVPFPRCARWSAEGQGERSL